MNVDVLIVGAGVVGLACAAECAKKGYTTLLIEQHESFGQETSSRNSEVIHSGIYYPAGSLKAKLCVAGNRSIYAECERLNVWHRKCGKLIVAVVPEEEPELHKLYEQGIANGVPELKILSREQVKQLEPAIACTAAMISPSTGIVDSHELMKAYFTEATQAGGMCVFGAQFINASRIASGYVVHVKESSGESTQIEARFVVNAAGLYADGVAASFGIDVNEAGYTYYPNRGHYYRVSASKSKMISRLVYPIPPKHKAGLGIHITIDKGNSVKLGPDTEYIDPSVSRDRWYVFDDSRKERFHQAVVRYFPALELDDLSPDQIGVRPKLQRPDGEVRDFIIIEESSRGLHGLINLIGIESPGLTCSYEIAKMVGRFVQEL
jgi:L-2-hydroxyglutarate oxidase LhgO